MAVKLYGMAIDPGNTRVKGIVYVDNKPVQVIFPSVRTQGTLEDLVRARMADGNKNFKEYSEALEPGEYVIKMENKPERYYGDLARTQDANASSGIGDTGRYWGDRIQEATMIVAGTAIPDEEAELYIVTNLPSQTFDPMRTVPKVIENLVGSYEFTLNDRKRYITVKAVKVLQEGAGAATLLFRPGRGTQGIIDIGGYSTDVYVADNLKSISKFCGGIPEGVEKIADLIDLRYQEYFNTDVHLSTKQRHEILMAYTFPMNCHYPTISYNRVSIANHMLRSWTEESAQTVGSSILEFIARIWKSGERGEIGVLLNDIWMIGGGAYTLQTIMNQRIKGITIPEFPELKNVLGGAVYAKILAAQKSA